MRRMVLRCMAYKEDGLFVAVCIDLSLAAQANTIEEAQAKLESQIMDYIEEAINDAEYTEQLLSRKAPLSLIWKYHLLGIQTFLFRCFGKRDPQQAKLV